MARTPKILTDDEVATRVLAKSKESVGWYDSRLSKERERVLKYYNGKLPARTSEGSSSYISTDVYDAVEMAKAQLLETFAGGDEIAQFDPDKDMDVDSCRVATEYARYVIFRQNDALGRFHDAIHDGLTNRAGVIKIFWDEKYTYSEETFENLSYEDAMGLASQDEVDEFDGTHDEATGLYSGTLCRKIDASKITIASLPPEEFLIAKSAMSIAQSDFTSHRTRMTKADIKNLLRSLDVKDTSVVNGLGADEAGPANSPEVIARNEIVENGQALDDAIQPEMDKLLLSESYVRMVIDRAKGVRLYKILHVEGKLLHKQEVDKAPFLAYVPLPIPHLFYGNNFAARVIPIQNATTVLTRAVLDHAAITTNPRWAVVKGGLLNPREMLENRLGGIVNVSRPDSVAALQYPNLNPFVFNVLERMKENKEQSTGISSLSQGLNKDAISKQNSNAMVDNLVSLSGQRQKIAARNFAKFFVELMIEVIRLTILHEDKAKTVEVSGKPLNIDPTKWTERTTCTVSMHLGYGEKEQAIQKHLGAHQMLSSDDVLKTMYTPQNRYELARDTMKLAGLTGAVRYITPADQIKPAGPDPMLVRELDIKEMVAKASMLAAQTAAGIAPEKLKIDAAKVDVSKHGLALQAVTKDRDGDRHDLETANRVDIGQREMALQESLPDETQNSVVAPNI